MIIDGTNIVVMSKDDLRKLLSAISTEWNKKELIKLQKLGILDLINEMRKIVQVEDKIF